MTAHLCRSAVRLFERSFNVEEGRLSGMTETLGEGPNDARAMATIGLVERFLRAIADERYEDTVFAGLGAEPSMSKIREPAMHSLRFSQQLLHECGDGAQGKGDSLH